MSARKPGRQKTIQMLSNTLRHCHNLYNRVGSEEQSWLAEINQAAKDAITLLKCWEDEERIGQEVEAVKTHSVYVIKKNGKYLSSYCREKAYWTYALKEAAQYEVCDGVNSLDTAKYFAEKTKARVVLVTSYEDDVN